MQKHFSTTIRFLAIAILLSLLAIPSPVMATGGNTLEICTAQGSYPYMYENR